MAERYPIGRPKVCKQCKVVYPIGAPGTLKSFCSYECNTEYIKPVSSARVFGIPSVTMGAASELYICYDLMVSGWHVFRCQSPSSPVDVVAIKSGEANRLIEVRTGTIAPGGYRYFSKHLNTPHLATELAVFYPMVNEVEYHDAKLFQQKTTA